MKLNVSNAVKGFNRFLRKRFRIFTTILVLAILAVGYLFLLSPKIAEVREVGLFGLQDTKDKLALKENLLELTRSLTDKYGELQLADIERLQSILPTAEDLPGLFVQVEALAQANGLTLQNVNFSEAAATTTNTSTSSTVDTTQLDPSLNPTAVQARPTLNIKEMNVTFVVGGGRGYDHLKQFLTGVESNIRLFDLQSLSYSPTTSDEGETYSMNAVTYIIGI